jgi:hypothetical protein
MIKYQMVCKEINDNVYASVIFNVCSDFVT